MVKESNEKMVQRVYLYLKMKRPDIYTQAYHYIHKVATPECTKWTIIGWEDLARPHGALKTGVLAFWRDSRYPRARVNLLPLRAECVGFRSAILLDW